MKQYKKVFSYILISLLAIVSVFSAVIATSPATAMAIAPDLPVVKELIRLDQENQVLKDKLEYNTEFMEKYKNTISEEERNAVGSVVLDFVSAQYSNDKEKMYSLSTQTFKQSLKSPKSPTKAYDKSVELKLVIVSNIVKQDDKYMAFIRIEDSRADSQYQENFYLEKSGDKFLISMIEQDI